MEFYITMNEFITLIKKEYQEMIIDHCKENSGFSLSRSCEVFLDLFGKEIFIDEHSNLL